MASSSVNWEDEKKRRRAQMLGKHSMSMPHVKSPSRSFESISAEDDDISSLRCSILNQRSPFDGPNPEPPAPKKFVRRSSSPEVDFNACSISEPDTEQPSSTTSTVVTDPSILATKQKFNALFSSPDSPTQHSGKTTGGSEQAKPPAKPPLPRGGMKMFASSMSSIQMKKALMDADEDDSPLDVRAGLRANMGTILEDLDEGDPNFQRVAKYMQWACTRLDMMDELPAILRRRMDAPPGGGGGGGGGDGDGEELP